MNDLNLLRNTFLDNDGGVYKTVHDKLFDFLAYYFGKKMLTCLIKNASSRLISERFLFVDEKPTDEFFIVVSDPEQQYMYFQRLIDDWLNGQIVDVFMSRNMKDHRFRKTLLEYVNSFEDAKQYQLAHTSDHVLGECLLILCCHYDDTEWIVWCLHYELDINKAGYHKTTPLLTAIENVRISAIETLIDNLVDVNQCVTTDGPSPLYLASEHGYQDIVQLLLKHGAEYDKCASPYGLTPLAIACVNEHRDVVRILSKTEADMIKGQTEFRISELHKACEKGLTKITKILLECHPDINMQAKAEGISPLYFACQEGHEEIVKLLLTKQADVNIGRRDIGASPLFVACQNGHTKLVEILLKNGARVEDSLIASGQSPLYIACLHGHTEIIRQLWAKGANVNAYTTDTGDTPLFAASGTGIAENTEILLKGGAEVNSYRHDAWLPLNVACDKGHKVIVELLLKYGAVPNFIFIDNKESPLETARRKGNLEIVKILEEWRMNKPPPLKARLIRF